MAANIKRFNMENVTKLEIKRIIDILPRINSWDSGVKTVFFF